MWDPTLPRLLCREIPPCWSYPPLPVLPDPCLAHCCLPTPGCGIQEGTCGMPVLPAACLFQACFFCLLQEPVPGGGEGAHLPMPLSPLPHFLQYHHLPRCCFCPYPCLPMLTDFFGGRETGQEHLQCLPALTPCLPASCCCFLLCLPAGELPVSLSAEWSGEQYLLCLVVAWRITAPVCPGLVVPLPPPPALVALGAWPYTRGPCSCCR